MRPVLVAALALLAAAALLAPTSGADTPARAKAQVSVVTGGLGDFGTLSARGDDEQTDDDLTVEAEGVRIGKADVVARAVRSDPAGAHSRAAALARHVDLFDGLVTASVARRTATAAGAKVVRSGRVAGLTIEGREIGDVRSDKSYLLSDGSSVAVNRGTAALELVLGAARGTAPKGTKVRVAVASASAADAVIATPTPTPSPTATATATPEQVKKKPERKKAPKVQQRLTGRRYAFPVYGEADVADDFGAARADTGKHQGNDVFAPFGAPVLAVADGTVHRVGTLPISGNRLWLHTDAGDAFFYAHLSAFSPDAQNGKRVKAGTVLGFTGNTGDAEPTPPHVHFEIHPGGESRDAIDPHAILLAWQRHEDVPPGAWLTRHGADTAERPGALVEVKDFIADN
jgi:murein DD-endopeptidase MepM/ murein hydrolase activator NlpD